MPKRSAPPTRATPGRRTARAAFGSPSPPKAAASPCGGWAGPAPGPALPELPSPPRAGACSPVTIARSATASPVAIRSAVTAHQAPEGRRCCARSGDVLKPAVLRHSPRARVSPGSRRACRAATGGFPPAAGPVEAGSSVRAGRPGGGYGSIGHHACGGRRGAPHDLCRAGRGPGDITGVSQAARPAASLGATDRQRRCHPGDSAALGPRHVRETRTNQGKECRPRQRSDVTGDRGASPGDTRCCHR